MPYELKQGITHSIISRFASCPQKAKYSLDGWEKPHPVGYLEFGDLFHICKENYYGSRYSKPIRNTDRLFDLVAGRWRKKQAKQPIDLVALGEIILLCKAVWTPYCDYWKKKDAKFKWESVEEIFDVQWRRHRLRGKIDGVFKLNRKRWTLETKTRGQIVEGQLLNSLAFDSQCLFYHMALESMERPAIGTVYNVVRRPGLRQGKKETQKEFYKRVRKDVETRPDHYFKRFEITFSQKQKEVYTASLLAKLEAFYEVWSGKGVFYRNEQACTGKGGACTYLQACAINRMLGYTKTRKPFPELEV